MNLVDVVCNLDEHDPASTIYASQPWSGESIAIVAVEPDEGGLPPLAKELGLKYFLEVSIASDFLRGWLEHLEAEPTAQEKCARLIQYAINDA